MPQIPVMKKVGNAIMDELIFMRAREVFRDEYAMKVDKTLPVQIYHDHVVFEDKEIYGAWILSTSKDGVICAFMADEPQNVVLSTFAEHEHIFNENLRKSLVLGSSNTSNNRVWEPVYGSECFEQAWNFIIAQSLWECEWRSFNGDGYFRNDVLEPFNREFDDIDSQLIYEWKKFITWLQSIQERSGRNCGNEIAIIEKKISTCQRGVPAADIAGMDITDLKRASSQ